MPTTKRKATATQTGLDWVPDGKSDQRVYSGGSFLDGPPPPGAGKRRSGKTKLISTIVYCTDSRLGTVTFDDCSFAPVRRTRSAGYARPAQKRARA
jgi:hypothetical protein